MPIIGIDFDNTIVCYDPIFFRAARDRKLIPAGFPASKESIRDHLRAAGQEEQWTELQALVYGEYIRAAESFPGVDEFFREAVDQEYELVIISHKTKKPYRGPDLDLRAAAVRWLESRSFLAPAQNGILRQNLFFEDTKKKKMARIAACKCELFVDDLPEFLTDPSFPTGVQRILFDPAKQIRRNSSFVPCHSWSEIQDYVQGRYAK